MRPHVSINMAISADGKIATANRSASSFGSRADHDHLLHLRESADAILTGAGTLNAQPNVTLRLAPQSKSKPPLRVIASGSGSVNLQHKIFRSSGAPILLLTTEAARRSRLKKLESLSQAIKICGLTEIDFPKALQWLAKQWGVKRLLCEGGGRLNEALFRAELVDEVNLTVCPLVLGGRDAPTIADGCGTDRLNDAAQFTLKTRRQVGDELFLVFVKA